MRDENNISRGFGFVSFKDPLDAKKALEENNPEGLYVVEAKTKEQRMAEI
jgi:RNA recognition motif-containing protein